MTDNKERAEEMAVELCIKRDQGQIGYDAFVSFVNQALDEAEARGRTQTLLEQMTKDAQAMGFYPAPPKDANDD